MKYPLCALLTTLAAQGASAYDFVSDDLAYTLISDTEVMVTANPGTVYPEELHIPSSVTYADHDYKVLGIGALAFFGCDEVLSVTIEEGVRSIGYKSFAESALGELTIPSTLVKIGDEAFFLCVDLMNVHGMEHIESLGVGVFRDCNALLEAELSEKLTRIPASTFEGCKTLRQVMLPADVTAVDDRAFADCRSLEYVVMPDGVRSIGSHCFAHCWDLAYLNLPEDLEDIGPYALSGCLTLREQEWPSHITSLPEGILSACRSLEFAYINPSIQTVGAKAYEGCESLETVSIAENLERIGSQAFADCPAIRYVYVDNVLPPTMQPNTFDEKTYAEAVLYVRPEVKELYRQSAQWSKFAHVESATSFPTQAGIGEVEESGRVYLTEEGLQFGADHGIWRVYSLDGHMVACGEGEGTVLCAPGLYILQWSDGYVVKVRIR